MTARSASVRQGAISHDAVLAQDGIIEKILDGYSLRTVMVPDPEIGAGSNYPEHLEGLDLPHIIINGDVFWAKTETCHLVHASGRADMGLVAWAYTNVGGYFCSCAPDLNQINVMYGSRYKSHEWVLVKSHELIWDSSNRDANTTIRDAIKRGARLKIAMLDDENLWNIHPVHLPFHYGDDDVFKLETPVDRFPWQFREPDSLKRDLDRKFAMIDENRSEAWDVGDSLPLKTEFLFGFYSLRSDGTYYTAYDVENSSTRNYKRLRVFAEHS